jgi:hypothetical protein
LRHGRSLRQLFTGELTWRELLTWIDHPVPGSSYARVVLGPEESVWTLETHLLAAIADRVTQGNWQRGGGKGPKPNPITRPGVTSGRKIGRTGGRSRAEIVAELEKMSGRTLPA